MGKVLDMVNKFLKTSLVCRVNGKVWFKELFVPQGTTAKDMLERAKSLQDFPLNNIENLAIGIYSNRVNYSYVMEDGDRLEIYEPLILTPAQARELRSKIQAKKNMNKI